MKEVISTKLAPAAIGPYSQAIVAGDLVFTPGQIPLSAETGLVVGDDVSAQAVQALDNLKAVLAGAGCDLDDVVKTTVFITDMSQFALVNEIYAKYFTEKAPARSCVEVSKLPKGCLVEVEAIAVRK